MATDGKTLELANGMFVSMAVASNLRPFYELLPKPRPF